MDPYEGGSDSENGGVNIQEEKPKRRTLLHKIDPIIPYFPVCDAASYDQLLAIRELYLKFQINQAKAKSQELKLNVDSNDENERFAYHRLNHWEAKAHYLCGNYKTCLELVEIQVKAF